MKKRIIVLLISTLLLAAMVSCRSKAGPDPTENTSANESEPKRILENPLVIMNESGAKIGEIDHQAGITALDDGIFYSVFNVDANSHTGPAEYLFFNLKDKTDVLLGNLEGQGYEAGFTRTELNGVVYTLAVKGDPYKEAVPLLLLAFDTANRTMKTYTVSEDGFPYTAMATIDGKLLIMNHETVNDRIDKIYEFDPSTEKIREVLAFPSTADSLRSICAADHGFYLLRLKLNVDSENEMYIDRYDENYQKTSELPVGDILVNAITTIHGILNRQDAWNEIGMNVSHFSVIDDRYMVYENFGLSRVIIDLQTKETLLAKDDNYSISMGNGAPVLYRVDYVADPTSEPEIFSLEDGKIRQSSFVPDKDHTLVQVVTTSANGTQTILTSDIFPVQNGTGVILIRSVNPICHPTAGWKCVK